MKKEEFLDGLSRALNNNISDSDVRENIAYYTRYIEDEEKKGRSEEDILAELGDARLIARSIIDSTPGAGGEEFENENFRESRTGNDAENRDFSEDPVFKVYNLNKWYYKLLAAVIIVGVLWLVFTIIGGVLTLVAPLIPVIGLIICVMWIMRIFRR